MSSARRLGGKRSSTSTRAQLSDPDEIAVGMTSWCFPNRRSPRRRRRSGPHDQHRRPDAPDQRIGYGRAHRVISPHHASPHPSRPLHQVNRRSAIPSSDGSPEAPATTVPTVEVPAVSLAGAGALLAAGVIGGLAWRRRVQLQTRPPGRRSRASAAADSAGRGRSGQPAAADELAHARPRACERSPLTARDADVAPPPLQLALVGDSAIELRMQRPAPTLRSVSQCVGAPGSSSPADVEYLKSVPGLSEAARPWPALVTLGRDEHERPGARRS